jgi:hypothetical protein
LGPYTKIPVASFVSSSPRTKDTKTTVVFESVFNGTEIDIHRKIREWLIEAQAQLVIIARVEKDTNALETHRGNIRQGNEPSSG